MGKASSSKKVARAKRAAGRPGAKKSYTWPIAIGAVVVLGVLLVVLSAGSRDAKSGPPSLGDHWHAAYGIYDCADFIPPLDDVKPDESGIHTHRDGLMHMHPFSTRYTGDDANIGNWGETVGLEVTDTSFDAGLVQRENGDPCGDGEEGVVQLWVWDSPGDEEPTRIESDLAGYAPPDQSIFVLAFAPEGTEIPLPPSAINLQDPTAAERGEPPLSEQLGTSTTVAGAEPEGTDPEGTETETETTEPETTDTSAPTEPETTETTTAP